MHFWRITNLARDSEFWMVQMNRHICLLSNRSSVSRCGLLWSIFLVSKHRSICVCACLSEEQHCPLILKLFPRCKSIWEPENESHENRSSLHFTPKPWEIIFLQKVHKAQFGTLAHFPWNSHYRNASRRCFSCVIPIILYNDSHCILITVILYFCAVQNQLQ